MKTPAKMFRSTLVRSSLAAGLAVASGLAGAALTDISPTPLSSSASAQVLPNLMFVLDDSGSMNFNYLPDYITDAGTCKTRANNGSGNKSNIFTDCQEGDPPFYAPQFNGAHYNPQITYKPAVNYDGTSMGSQGSPWTSVKVNAFTSSSTINLTNGYPELVYCDDSGLTNCRRNGIDTNTTFEYRTPSSGDLGKTYSYPESSSTYTMVAGSTSQTAGRSGTTVTFNSTNHGLTVGDRITVTGSSTSSSGCPNEFRVTNASVITASANSFTYASSSSGTISAASRACTVTRLGYRYQKTITGTPFYYTITPKEYCSDANLTTCVASTNPTTVSGVAYAFPANVRFCAAQSDADAAAPVSGGSKCQAKYTDTYKFPRYGSFTRTTIDSSTATYGGRPNRIDCVAAPVCTYKEEMTNFANWYAYYRTRMQMMKTAAGHAFLPIDNRYRVGFVTINPGSPVSSDRYLKIQPFTPSNKKDWYKKFYDTTTNGSTPLREALSRVGRHFAGITSGINKGMSDDPMEYSCQQNFALLTTDGYWNGNSGQNLNGNSIGNQDNDQTIAPKPMWDGGSTGTTVATKTDKSYSLLSYSNTGCSNTSGTAIRWKLRTTTTTTVTTTVMSGSVIISTSISGPTTSTSDGSCVSSKPTVPAPTSTTSTSSSGGTGGSSDSLADVAMYYYRTDLRGAGSIGALGNDVSRNNVPTSTKDTAAYQHMTTFALGIVDGLMSYRSDYETATSGDFANIKNGNSGCSWVSGQCQWPIPSADDLSALDDLWHAATNGRGTFYQARDPSQVADGLSSALAGMNARTAAAAASATSSPNITPTDRSIFSSTYTTVEWAGEVVAQDINVTDGSVIPTIKWSAQSKLDARTTDTSDSRTIYVFDGSVATTKLKNFTYANLSSAEKAFFDNKCVPVTNLSQCITLTGPQLTVANNGTNLVNFLRGWRENEGGVYRTRSHLLGDTVNATPAYLREPRFNFGDAVTPTYTSFKKDNEGRQASLFIAANDGMLHAFNADTGEEMWAYVPKMVLPNLYKLAEENYATKHQYFVDGSPELMDIYAGGAWKTILVAGLNSGGRGYYAIDVTNPGSPKALWEFCSDSTVCANYDTDLGLTYGNPVITKRPSDGKWVVIVASGYNNTSPGTGRGYLYVLDAITGAVLSKTDTGAGDTTTPLGLAKISVWADAANIDNTGLYAYGGDLRGNLWRFDLTGSSPSVMKMASLADSAGRPQSVTSRPELGLVQGNRVIFVGTGRYLGTSDLQDPASWIPASTDAYQQTMYAIKDRGTTYGNLRTASSMVQQTLSIVSDTERKVSTNAVDWTNNNGWYVDFNPDKDSPGERVNLDPQLILGTLLVATNVPNTDACTIGGESWIYQFNYQTGQFVSTSQNNIVARKSPDNAITVGIVVVRLPNGQLKGIVTSAGGTKGSIGVNVGGTSASGKRTSWREIFE